MYDTKDSPDCWQHISQALDSYSSSVFDSIKEELRQESIARAREVDNA